MKIQISTRRQAAHSALDRLFGEKVASDLVTYEEVSRHLSADDDPRNYREWIRRWFRGHGNREIIAVDNVGWRICTGTEQIGVAVAHGKKAIRQKRIELRAAVTADRTDMNAPTQRLADHVVASAATHLSELERTHRATRSLMGGPSEGLPRLSAQKK